MTELTMNSNLFAIYGLLFSIYLSLFVVIKSLRNTKEILSNIHFGLFGLFALQGLASLSFGLAGIELSLKNINLALLIPILLMATVCYQNRQKIKPAISAAYIDRHLLFAYLICLLLAITAGLLFFTTDLIPSSMTGDPARHFMQIINPAEISQAPTHKPIYYLWGGIFIHALPALQNDQLFVLFNLFVLGLSTISCLLILLKIFPCIGRLPILTAAMLINFGYSLFALHFGYYTLLLSSAYLFSMLAALVEYKNSQDEKIYWLIALLAIGIVLTHSYLAPDALFCLFMFDIWNARRKSKKTLSAIAKHLPFWMLIVLVAYASNLGIATGDAIERVIGAHGFVNNAVFLNLLPFLPFAAWYFAQHWRKDSAQLILLFTLATTLFSIIMGVLFWNGHAAPYYLNRNQIILLPLLLLAIIGLIHEAETNRRTFTRGLYIFLAVLVITPYLLVKNQPLSQSHKIFRDLLDDEAWVYLENPINTSYAPLQMTARDRTLMRQIGSGESNCLAGVGDKVAVLGTDHQTIWFYLYTHIYPSLFQRDDGFIGFDNYLRNYKEWKADPANQYIVIVSHFDTLYASHLAEKIRTSTQLVCKGDSIAIYRKP